LNCLTKFDFSRTPSGCTKRPQQHEMTTDSPDGRRTGAWLLHEWLQTVAPPEQHGLPTEAPHVEVRPVVAWRSNHIAGLQNRSPVSKPWIPSRPPTKSSARRLHRSGEANNAAGVAARRFVAHKTCSTSGRVIPFGSLSVRAEKLSGPTTRKTDRPASMIGSL
jgi:hypothetical protein